MAKSRAQKSFINVGVMIIYEVVVLVCGLITPKLILVHYGSAYNGVVSSITQFLSLITILRAGVAGATRVALYKTLADDDVLATSRIVRATEIFLRKIAYIFLGYLAVLAVGFKFIAETDISWGECASLVVIIGLGTFAQYYFGLTYQTLLTADQKNYIYFIQQTLITIANTIIAVIMIENGASIQAFKLGSAAVFVAGPILLSMYVKKKYKLIKKCEPDNAAINQKWDVMGLAIANIIHENTDVVILTFFCSDLIVSVYMVYTLVINGLKKVLSVFTTGLEAAFGNMWAKNEKSAIKRNLGIFELMIYSFISIVFSCTMVLILPFVQLYTTGTKDIELVNYIRPDYAMIAVLAQAFFCMRMPYMTLVQAAGKYRETRNGSFVEAGINLVLSMVLVPFFSLVGVAIGTLAADIFRTVQYAKYCCDHLVDISYWQVAKRFIWTIVNIGISMLFYFVISHILVIDSWGMWVVAALLMAVFSSLITLISAFIFYRKDLHETTDVFKRTLFKKKKKA